jgi:diguanylate cyclase (GGDEF)-like protein
VEAVCELLEAEGVMVIAPDGIALAGKGRTDLEPAGALAVPIGIGDRSYGELRVWAQGLTPRRESFVAGIARVLLNSIERRRQEEATQHQATHDPITDLPNRLLLRERLRHEVARAGRDGTGFALCLLDVDDFKLINDTLGHAAGDDLLRAIAGRLDASMRATDMLARLGGDEFVVLGPDLDSQEEAEALARRVSEALRPPFAVQGSDLAVRASIGVVLGDAGSSPDALLRDVDLAMYDAKARGRGQQAVFDDSMRERMRSRVKTEDDLTTALRDGDLLVYYQPVVAAGSRQVSGVEALVRWMHPERGLVPPDEFIPVAEASGQIIELGQQVMGEACRQLVRWRADGLVDDDFSVAVNVSWRQLTRPGFPGDVARILAETGLDPGGLGLEITETIAMESAEHSGEVLAELAGLGVELLLDDFGTGASSLARLKRLPVDTLKIDRAFVRGVGDREDEDDAIVAAILAMAEALGLTVVAEGVETEVQLRRLEGLGCQLIQGFLFSRPLPPRELEELLRTAAARVHPAGLALVARGATA